jgi:hypothetical protein
MNDRLFAVQRNAEKNTSASMNISSVKNSRGAYRVQDPEMNRESGQFYVAGTVDGRHTEMFDHKSEHIDINDDAMIS